MKEIFKLILAFITHRLFILSVLFLVMFYLLFVRLFNLQIVQGEKLAEDFSLYVLREREIEGQRGYIYDKNGYPLAENVLAYTVLLDGSMVVENQNQMALDLYNTISENGDEVVRSFPIELDNSGNFIFTGTSLVIAQFRRDVFVSGTSDPLTDEQLTMNAENMYAYVRDYIFKIPTQTYTDEEIIKILNIRFALWLKRFSQYNLETIAINISDETLASIAENSEAFPGVSIAEDPLRMYNDSKYFSHIIGYIRTIDADTLESLESLGYDATDIVGQIGVEEEMELYLHGQSGTETVEVDNLGRTMDVLDVEDPVTGKDVYLTIDKDLQIACYDALEEKLASIIVDNLVVNSVEDEDEHEILMNDIFVSLFNNDTISIDKIESSVEGEYQNIIFSSYTKRYQEVVDVLDYALTSSDISLNDKYRDYFSFILNNLKTSNYLASNYKEYEIYEAYQNNEIAFKDLLSNYVEEGYMTIVVDEESNLNSYDVLCSIILEEYMNYEAFKKMIYMDLVENKEFSLINMCLLLIEQDIVSATDEEFENLKNYKLSTLNFIKEKIINLELTPQELAIDPYSGSVVVVDVHTGEVLSLVSYPSYDNNYLVNDFDDDYYNELLNDPTSPLYPRATMSKTAPGSTFKMVSALTGLEEGAIDANEYITCLGNFQKIVPNALCWIYSYGSTHGPLTVSDAIEVSCNYFFYEVGYRLCYDENGDFYDSRGIEMIQKYAAIFGLDRPTGLEIGDADSTLADADAVRTAIGQSNQSYTPVQLARYIATLANGGTCYQLELIDKVLDNDGNIFMEQEPIVESVYAFDEENLEAVQYGMYLATHGSSGSSRWAFGEYPVEVAGKTGTAQESTSRPDHGLFASFAPYDDPDIAVVCVIPFGYSSSNAVGLAQKVYDAYYELNEADNIYSVNHIIDE
jgi:penicillin-binding protein 2